MKITRKISGKQVLEQQKVSRTEKKKRRNRRVLTGSTSVDYIKQLDQTVNNPTIFSFADYNRNAGRIELLKMRFNDMIRTHGVDLIYYRKFNTFFQEDEQNHANMIYGEDTTAEFYLSGAVRAYLSINKQDFAFNLTGYESQQQIDIWLTIDDFRQRFATVLGKVKSDLFAVPVTGDIYNQEYYGYMDIPEFYAQIYGQLNGNDKRIINAYPQIKQRALTSQFFNSFLRNDYLEPLTGYLNGQLTDYLPDETSLMSGILKGEIFYHSFENIENSPSWNVAPQVGDYFKFKVGELEEEYQVNQVLDKQITKDGLNPLLGRYLYRCKAVRRTPSEEVHHEAQPTEIGADINDMLGNPNITDKVQTQTKTNYSEYTAKEDKKNVQNKRTNKIAKGIYQYKDGEDVVYGGYTDVIPSEQIEHFHKV